MASIETSLTKINLPLFIHECGRQMKCQIVGRNVSEQLEDVILKLKATMHDLESTRRECRRMYDYLNSIDDDEFGEDQFVG